MSVLKHGAVWNWCRCASLLVALCTMAHAAGTNFASVFGGSGQDYAASVASDASGNIYVAGLTYSPDLHVTPGAFQTALGGNGSLANPYAIASDAFVAKFALDGTLIWSTFLGGSADDYATGVGVDGGGNVVVTGWTRSLDFPVLNVTIDGQPAFLSYISPTQINLQVPSDNTLGTVNVTVDNNGSVSAPATVQLQNFASAFFIYPGTNFVFASVLPNYLLSADPSTVAGATAAHPGDTLVLWATGFGPTTPTAPAGTVVSGVPMGTTPTVTVGGVPVQVLNSILTAGSAGLYQITIQLPANVPTGAVAIQASVGGAQTQSGATIFVGKL